MKPLKQGQKVDSFQIINPDFARGSTGPVALARSIDGKECILKFLLKSDAVGLNAQFKSEFKFLTGLAHPNIAKSCGFGFFDGAFYLATEFIDGLNIFDASYDKPWDEVVGLFLAVLDALDFIHRNGILHLDIKPENILVEKNSGAVKLIDLGVACESVKFNNLVQGTVPYMAPEIIDPILGSVGARSDLFSFAATFYFCLTRGELPFFLRSKAIAKNGVDYEKLKKIIATEKLPSSIASQRRDVPAFVDDILAHLFQHQPAERFYANARAVKNAFLFKRPDVFGSKEKNLYGASDYFKPVGNAHVGREKLQMELLGAIGELVAGVQPSPPLIYLEGSWGVGRTHLLQKICDSALQNSEKIFVSHLKFPVDDNVFEEWRKSLICEFAENERAVFVALDDIHDPDISERVKSALSGIVSAVAERASYGSDCPNLRPAFLVATARADDDETNGFHLSDVTNRAAEFRVQRLEPFEKEDIEAYLKLTPAIGNKEIPKKWLEQIYFRSSGIPAELVYVLADLDEHGAVFDPAGEIAIPAVEEPSVHMTSWHGAPISTSERLKKQYEKLGPIEREIIELISVWGHLGVTRVINERDLAEFFFLPTIAQTLGNLIEKGVLVFKDNEATRPFRSVEFVNPYMQTVIYGLLGKEARQAFHAGVANHLKSDRFAVLLHRAYATKDPILLLKLHANLIRGGYSQSLVKYVLEDIANLSCVLANPKLSLFVSGLMIECRSRRGEHLLAEREFVLADERLQLCSVDSLSKRAKELARYFVARKYLPSLIQRQLFDDAEKIINDIQGHLPKNASIPTAVMNNFKARIFYEKYFYKNSGGKSDLQKALSIYDDSLSLEADIFPDNLSCIQNNERGYVLLLLGRHEEALKSLKELYGRHKREKNYFGEVVTSVAIANVYQALKDFGGAEEFTRHALEISKRLGHGKYLLISQQNLANIYHESGENKKALETARKCLAVGALIEDAADWKVTKGQILVLMGDCCLRLKMLDLAVTYFESALETGVAGQTAIIALLGLAEAGRDKKSKESLSEGLSTAKSLIEELPKEQQREYLEVLARLSS